MDAIFVIHPLPVLAFAFGVTLLAGMIKGIVGFAMPMVMISGLGSVMSPELAVAGLIVPTLATNAWQALRGGVASAWRVVRRYRVFLLSGLVVMLLSAQLVPLLPAQGLFILIGVPIVVYASLSLAGKHLHLPEKHGAGTEAMIGSVAGFFGGIAGVWGPPTVAMLTAKDTQKREHVQIQGVVYALGAMALVGAHIGSGVLRVQTLPLSVMLVAPALAGMWLGYRVHDRIDQSTFRRLTLLVLLIAGANLIRRGF